MNQFGETIRQARLKKSLLLRDVANYIGADLTMLSKMERGERGAKKEFLNKFCEILGLDYKELHTLWLADRIYNLVEGEENALESMKVAEEEVTYQTQKKKTDKA